MSLPILTRPFAVLAGVAVLVAACGGTAATGGPGATGASATQSTATQPAGAATAPGMSFDLPNEDAELEALLPDDIGGEPVQKLSMGGTSFLGSGGGEEFTQILTQFGKTPADMSVALGGNGQVQLAAFQVRGVDAGQLFQAFISTVGASDGGVVSDATVAGKSVKKLVSAEGEVSYIYASGDVLFTVVAGDSPQALVDETFSKLR